MGLRMEWDIDSEIKVDIATFTIPLALTRNLGLRLMPSKPTFLIGGRDKVVSGHKWSDFELPSSCRQPLAEIRWFSRHLKHENLEFYDA